MLLRNRMGLFLLAGLLSAVSLSAQVVTGAISGRIADTTGAVIPGAAVQIQNVETGLTRSVEADEAGRYVVRNLPVGSYAITAQRTGFRTEVRRGVTLTVGSEAVVNMELSVGAVQETVEVTGEAPAIETTSATLSGLVSSVQMQELPLNGRSYDQLALLSAGVAEQPQGNRNQIVGAGMRMSINGARPNATLYLLDGTTVNDYTSNGPGSSSGQSLGVGAIREFRVLAHSFSAEYGRNGGAVISAVTQSGTNSYHGSLYEFFRNNVLDARDFFNPDELPPFRRNQFGASLGGRLVRDRVFFFANYEALRQRRGVTVIATVPDLNARRGLVPDPVTRELRPVTLNPASVPYLNLYPLPNGRNFGIGTAESLADVSSADTENYAMERMDFQLSEKDSLYWRYVFNPSDSIGPRSLPVFFDKELKTNHYAVVSETHIFSATALNEFRFAFNRTVPATGTGPFDLDPSLSFIPGQGFGQITFTQIGSDSGANAGTLAEMGTRRPAPQIFLLNLFQATDTFSYVKGAHSWKWGFDLERNQTNTSQLAARRGTYRFGSLLDLLAGRPNLVQFALSSATSTGERGWRNILFGWFVQDDIRVRPNLTLNLGFRHEFITTPYEVNGRSASLRNLSDPLGTVGPPFEPSQANFAPRVGLAWDPTGSGKTSVRLGAGVFHNQLLGRVWGNTTESASNFKTTFSVTNPPNFPRALESGFTPGVQNTGTIQFHPNTPTIIQYNAEVQRELIPTLRLRLGYVGSHGYNLERHSHQNIRVAQILPDGSQFFLANAPRVNPRFADIEQILTDSRTNYNGLQMVLDKAFSHGLQLQANYTWSKNMSDSDTTIGAELTNGIRGALDVYDLDRDYSLSSYDQRNSFVLNSVYKMPWEKRLNSRFIKAGLGGWQINGVLRTGSGVPINARVGFNNSRNGDNNIPDRPNLVAGASNNPNQGTSRGCPGIPAGEQLGTPDRYFDPCSFALNPAGTFGNVGRNTLIGPGLFNVDFGIVKNTAIVERMNLEFRAEFFNLINHSHFAAPNNSIFSSDRTYTGSAGRISATASNAREIQFGLKLTF